MLELSLGLRFLKEGGMQTVLIVLGIVVGVAVLIFLNALIGGLQQDLLNQTVGNSPHVTVQPKERMPSFGSSGTDAIATFQQSVSPKEDPRPIQNWQALRETIEAGGDYSVVSPVVNGAGFVSRGGTTRPITIKALDLDSADQIYNIKQRLVAGNPQIGRNQILLGSELAAELRLDAGNQVRLSTAEGISVNATVNGLFDLGNKTLNTSWVFISIGGGQTLLGKEAGISALELQVLEVFSAADKAEEYSQLYPQYTWVSWQEENTDLLSALNSQSASSYLIQAFVLIAVAMGISSVLAVSVIQKSRQIGILKALGLTTRSISRLFLIQGAILGFAGALLGSLAGAGLTYLFLLFVRDERGDTLFPVQLEPQLFVFAIGVATLAGMAAAWFPSRRAARLDPAEVIRDG